MDLLKAQLLLSKAANLYVKKQQNYSKGEIISKINEIKYLSAQKKVPKLTLRKEIIHLENKLSGIFEIEQRILDQERRESARVIALKKEIATLRARLANSEDKDLQLKVDRLSHLLAECLARKELKVDVALARKVRDEVQERPKITLEDHMIEKIHLLEKRLEFLKSNLGKKSNKVMQDRIDVIEAKIKEYYIRHPELRNKRKPVIKHTLKFNVPPPQKDEV